MPNALMRGRAGRRRPPAVAAALLLGMAAHAAHAGDGLDLTLPPESPADPSAPAPVPDSPVETAGISGYFADWADRVARARATQPGWASPLVTTTGLLEQRVRFDAAQSQAGNGTDTTTLDGGKGLDMIVSDSNEIRIALPPYNIRSGAPAAIANGQPIQPLSGFGDWTILRVEQRLASSPASDGDYILSAWLQILAPTGIARLTTNTWAWSPVLAYGKGWGDFDIQGTFGTTVPAMHAGTLGHPVQNNVALQYHIRPLVWPQIEANWTWFPDGQRGGLNQVFLTPGVVLGRIPVGGSLGLSLGVGYQVAVSPAYRATPLTPLYDHAWLFSSRMSF
jgi:hypothetical protein